MRIVGIILVVSSALLMAAHFMRADLQVLVPLALGGPLLLVWRSAWATRTVQILLVCAGGEWVRTLVALARERQAAGEPWTRMAVILGVVAAVAVLAALLVRPAPAAPEQPARRSG